MSIHSPGSLPGLTHGNEHSRRTRSPPNPGSSPFTVGCHWPPVAEFLGNPPGRDCSVISRIHRFIHKHTDILVLVVRGWKHLVQNGIPVDVYALPGVLPGLTHGNEHDQKHDHHQTRVHQPSRPLLLAPVAEFKAIPLDGIAPLSVAFTDLSTNTPTSWFWSFGDGNTSTAPDPVNVYTLPGVLPGLTHGNEPSTEARSPPNTGSSPSRHSYHCHRSILGTDSGSGNADQTSTSFLN